MISKGNLRRSIQNNIARVRIAPIAEVESTFIHFFVFLGKITLKSVRNQFSLFVPNKDKNDVDKKEKEKDEGGKKSRKRTNTWSGGSAENLKKKTDEKSEKPTVIVTTGDIASPPVATAEKHSPVLKGKHAKSAPGSQDNLTIESYKSLSSSSPVPPPKPVVFESKTSRMFSDLDNDEGDDGAPMLKLNKSASLMFKHAAPEEKRATGSDDEDDIEVLSTILSSPSRNDVASADLPSIVETTPKENLEKPIRTDLSASTDLIYRDSGAASVASTGTTASC